MSRPARLRAGAQRALAVALLPLLTTAGCDRQEKVHDHLRSIVIDPASGPAAGGTSVTVRLGEYAATAFGPGAQVTFDGVPGRMILISDQAVIVESPPHAAGAVEVRALVDGPGSLAIGQADGFTYQGAGGTTNPGATPGGGGATPGGGTTPAGQFAFIPGTDKWYVIVDDPQLCDDDRDGRPDLDQMLDLAADNQGGQGAFSGKLLEAADLVMGYGAQYFGNNPDGSLAASGIEVSFQRVKPGAGTTPPRGESDTPATRDDYNQMAFHFLGGTSATTGQAIVDQSGDNARIENNSGRNANLGVLGVFPDREVDFWNRGGIPTSQRTLENFCRLVGATLAHEIGHSLGLQHDTTAPRPPATWNIMSPTAQMDPSEVLAFAQNTYMFLQSYMPGPLRCQHLTGFAPRLQLAGADLVVVARARALDEGLLRLTVQEVLVGDASLREGTLDVGGFADGRGPASEELAGAGLAVWFLARDERGARLDDVESQVVPLEGRDLGEWSALVRDYARLRASPDLAAYAARLERSLASADARIRGGALVELAWDRAAVEALSPAGLTRVAELAGAGELPAATRAVALMALVHAADPAFSGAALGVGLGSDDPRLLSGAAGVLEAGLGLAEGAALVREALPGLEPAARGRALVLLGWLQDRESVALLTGELDGVDAARAANALGRIGAPAAAALPALEDLASGTTDEALRLRALRAIGRIGGAEARAWLTAQESTLGAPARFARDHARGWLLAD